MLGNQREVGEVTKREWGIKIIRVGGKDIKGRGKGRGKSLGLPVLLFILL